MWDYRWAHGDVKPVVVLQTRSPEDSGYNTVKKNRHTATAPGQVEERVSVKGSEHVIVKCFDQARRYETGLFELLEDIAILKRVDCPNVAKVHDFFADDKHIYVVTDTHPGGDLTEVQARAKAEGTGGPVGLGSGAVGLSEAQFQTIFRQAFSGLTTLQRSAVMHCDLRPETIVMKNQDYAKPEVVLTDTGLGKAFPSRFPLEDPATGEAWEKVICGTPGYIPPETWQRQTWVPNGDIFSLGVTMFMLSTNYRGGIEQEHGQWHGIFMLQAGDNPGEWKVKPIEECKQYTLRYSPDLKLMRPASAELRDVVEACLKKRPEERPQARHVLRMALFAKDYGEHDRACWFFSCFSRAEVVEARER